MLEQWWLIQSLSSFRVHRPGLHAAQNDSMTELSSHVPLRAALASLMFDIGPSLGSTRILTKDEGGQCGSGGGRRHG